MRLFLYFDTITRHSVASFSSLSSKHLLLPSTSSLTTVVSTRKVSLRFNIRQKFANYSVNHFLPEYVIQLGPDLACLRWLMNCGATCVKMSDGTEITSQKQMRKFIESVGGERNTQKRITAPQTELVQVYESTKLKQAAMRSDLMFIERWPNVAPVFIDEVDATDAAMTDRGFQYFAECRQIRRLKMNFCDYFGDVGLRELALGRPSRTLYDLEITMNPTLSDAMVIWLAKMRQLKRLHLYFLPYVVNREGVLRELRTSLPLCTVTFPVTKYIGYGYEQPDETKPGSHARNESRRIAKQMQKDTF